MHTNESEAKISDEIVAVEKTFDKTNTNIFSFPKEVSTEFQL